MQFGRSTLKEQQLVLIPIFFLKFQCRYIFSTEGHLLPATPEISLADEHCSYFGAFCRSGVKKKYQTSDVKHKEANDTANPYSSWGSVSFPSRPKSQKTISVKGLIKVSTLVSWSNGRGFLGLNSSSCL